MGHPIELFYGPMGQLTALLDNNSFKNAITREHEVSSMHYQSFPSSMGNTNGNAGKKGKCVWSYLT